MGRPIKKKFFGNTNVPPVGGEAVASVTMSTTTFFESTLTVTVTFGNPTLPTGVTASGTAVKTGNTVTSVTVVSGGGGYLAVPTVTLTDGVTTSTTATTAVLTTTKQNAIVISAFVPGGSSAVAGDIIKQASSTRYSVTTAQGTGTCKLVAAASTQSGEMTVLAVDSDSGDYYVTKLTARKARLVPNTGTQFSTNTMVKWTFDSPVENVSVQIENN
jgi:hypothetical protein